MLLATLLATNKCVGGQMLIKQTELEISSVKYYAFSTSKEAFFEFVLATSPKVMVKV